MLEQKSYVLPVARKMYSIKLAYLLSHLTTLNKLGEF